MGLQARRGPKRHTRSHHHLGPPPPAAPYHRSRCGYAWLPTSQSHTSSHQHVELEQHEGVAIQVMYRQHLVKQQTADPSAASGCCPPLLPLLPPKQAAAAP